MADSRGLVNLDYLFEMTGGDRALSAEILDMFMELVPAEIDLAIQAWKNGDEQAAGKIVHKIKPNYLYLGMNDWHDRLKAMELDLSDGNQGKDYLPDLLELKTVTDQVVITLVEEKKNLLND